MSLREPVKEDGPGGAPAAAPFAGVLEAIGATPLVRLTRTFSAYPVNVYAKLEALNPGGSIKDRTAWAILRGALERGEISARTVVIESTSGNMGVGLAQACAYLGLRLICVVDPKTTAQNVQLIRAYGAQIDLVREPDPVSGEFLQARLDRVRALAASIPDSFWPNQYANPDNPAAHHVTMHEIARALPGGAPDYLYCATSTCGTLRGCAEYVRARGLPTRVVAVDAIGSVIFGGPRCKRLVPGHGASVVPALFDEQLADEAVQVSDLDCIRGCRRLAREEAILAGGSSGAVVAALDKTIDRIARDATCVLIFPDRGERYLDTVYSDAWVQAHFGSELNLEGTEFAATH